MENPLHVHSIYLGSKAFKAWMVLMMCSLGQGIYLALVSSYHSAACTKGYQIFLSKRNTIIYIKH